MHPNHGFSASIATARVNRFHAEANGHRARRQVRHQRWLRWPTRGADLAATVQ